MEDIFAGMFIKRQQFLMGQTTRRLQSFWLYWVCLNKGLPLQVKIHHRRSHAVPVTLKISFTWILSPVMIIMMILCWPALFQVGVDLWCWLHMRSAAPQTDIDGMDKQSHPTGLCGMWLHIHGIHTPAPVAQYSSYMIASLCYIR